MCWSRNPLDLRRHITSARRVYSIVEAGSYDIVHVHTPVAAFITRFALRRIRRRGLTKIVYTAHGFHFHPLAQPIKRAIFILLERIAARWTDRLVVINQHDKMAAEKFHIARKNKIVYMPGIGIDRAEYCPERITSNDILKMKADIGLSSGAPLFVMVAEFITRKRHIDLIDALMGIDRQVHVAFAGEGKLVDSMKAYVKEKELGDRVSFSWAEE